MEEWLLSSHHAEGTCLGPEVHPEVRRLGVGRGKGEYHADGHFVFILPS